MNKQELKELVLNLIINGLPSKLINTIQHGKIMIMF